MAPVHTDRSIPGIVGDLLNHFTVLVRTESELARTEMSEKLTQMIGALVLAMAGAVLVIPALVILMEAMVSGITTTGLEFYWAAFAIGGFFFIIGLILALVGIAQFKAKRLMPNKTIHQLQEDAAVAKRQVRRDHDYERAA